jgi:hypothetical protein
VSFFKAIRDKSTSPEAGISLKLNKTSFALGENIEGTLTVSSSEDFEVTEIRCEIERIEEAKRLKRVCDERFHTYTEKEFNESATLYSARPAVSGPLKMNDGYTGTFPLSLNIPAGGRPTYKSVDDNITWLIKGVIAIDGRLDITSMKTEIQVLQPSAAPAEAVVKEVIREVVMIRASTVEPSCSKQKQHARTAARKGQSRFFLPSRIRGASYMPSPL